MKNKNIKIAKQLIKIAKNIIQDNQHDNLFDYVEDNSANLNKSQNEVLIECIKNFNKSFTKNFIVGLKLNNSIFNVIDENISKADFSNVQYIELDAFIANKIYSLRTSEDFIKSFNQAKKYAESLPNQLNKFLQNYPQIKGFDASKLKVKFIIKNFNQ